NEFRDKEASIRRAILLSLGDKQHLSKFEQEEVLQMLREQFSTTSDPGIHGAAEWVLRQWGEAHWLRQASAKLVTDEDGWRRKHDWAGSKPNWFVNGQGQTMVIVPGPQEFWMGDRGDAEKREKDKRQWVKIGLSFAIASKEVTVAQFGRFDEKYFYEKLISPEPDCPMNDVNWHKAAEYCNWLSEQEKIPNDQWCYEPIQPGKPAIGMKAVSHFLERTGYR